MEITQFLCYIRVSAMVNRFLIFALLFFGAATARAQLYLDVAGTFGTAYYIGDLNKRHFRFNTLRAAGGASFRINYNPRWSWKQSIMVGSVRGDDADAALEFQQLRNLSFYSPIVEASSTVEFNFFRFHPWKDEDRFTPYTYVGIGLFYMNPQTELEGNRYVLKDHKTEGEDYSNVQFALPFGAGFKFKLNARVFIGIDWGMRRNFTDYMDDVSGYYPENPDELPPITVDLSDRSLEQQGPDGTNWGTLRGNPRDNDWHIFTGISLIINLNEDPGRCYFNQIN